jgi:bla regulator protein BlaR1
VDPAYGREMKAFGYTPLSLDALIAARDHGIDPDYVGYQLTLAQLISARDHGVDPEFVRGLAALGYEHLSIEDLTRLRDHGVDPEYAKAENGRKHAHLTIDDLVRLRDTGGDGADTQTAVERLSNALDRFRAFIDRLLKK